MVVVEGKWQLADHVPREPYDAPSLRLAPNHWQWYTPWFCTFFAAFFLFSYRFKSIASLSTPGVLASHPGHTNKLSELSCPMWTRTRSRVQYRRRSANLQDPVLLTTGPGITIELLANGIELMSPWTALVSPLSTSSTSLLIMHHASCTNPILECMRLV
ncbi:hypothetical protein BC827DRAFT_1189709 [Russula dissimulans]|jgi:hypothetical protein|nr:hypothetical protein BC827DRAFT_1189709 [Russula dissimulans]